MSVPVEQFVPVEHSGLVHSEAVDGDQSEGVSVAGNQRSAEPGVKSIIPFCLNLMSRRR